MSKKQLISLTLCGVMLLGIVLVLALAPIRASGTANGGHEAARIQFLSDMGYTADVGSGTVETVCLPETFDEVFLRYNDLQQTAGYDLTPYRGKTVERWTYPLTNYPYSGTVHAHLLVRDGTIIGGDIAATVSGGFQHGLISKR